MMCGCLHGVDCYYNKAILEKWVSLAFTITYHCNYYDSRFDPHLLRWYMQIYPRIIMCESHENHYWLTDIYSTSSYDICLIHSSWVSWSGKQCKWPHRYTYVTYISLILSALSPNTLSIWDIWNTGSSVPSAGVFISISFRKRGCNIENNGNILACR